jgi:hypothetical protein
VRLPYEPDDDAAAEPVVDAALRSKNLATWRALNSPEYVLQTFRVLRAMVGRVGLTFTRRNADLDVARAQRRAGKITAEDFAQQLEDFKRWKKAAATVQNELHEQLGRTRDMARAVSGDAARDDLRELVHTLAMALDEHRSRQERDDYEPTEADRLLWARLATLSLPTDNGPVPLAEVVRSAHERTVDRRTRRR